MFISSQFTSSGREESVTGTSKAMGQNYHLPFPLFQNSFRVAWKHLVHRIPVRTDTGGAPEAHCGNGLRYVPECNQLQKRHCEGP